MIAATGCRISEALALTPRHIDFEACHVTFRSLKKRGRPIFRTVPLPASLLGELRMMIDDEGGGDLRLWPWSRMTGYRRICEVMESAGVEGPHASPKGLRHGFAIRAIQTSIPLNLVQRWLGHADIKTTAIYSNAVGPEEREIASRMWGDVAEREPGRVSVRPEGQADGAFAPRGGRDDAPWTPAEALRYFQTRSPHSAADFT